MEAPQTLLVGSSVGGARTARVRLSSSASVSTNRFENDLCAWSAPGTGERDLEVAGDLDGDEHPARGW